MKVWNDYFYQFKILIVNTLLGEWEHWNIAMSSAIPSETTSSDYSQVLVPILESVRITYLINIIATQEQPVLLIGEQGSGKTVMMKSNMRSAKPELYLNRSFNFSSATSPYQFQVFKLNYFIKLILFSH